MSYKVIVEKDSRVERKSWVNPKGKEYVFVRQEVYFELPDVKHPQLVWLSVAQPYPEGHYLLQNPLILVGGEFRLKREFELSAFPVEKK